MLVNAILWIILAGLIVIVPVGCFMTRQRGHAPHPPSNPFLH